MKKPLLKFFLILTITLFSLYISLPKELPLRFPLLGIETDYVFKRSSLDFSIFGKDFSHNYDIKLGLDLAGGSHLVFEADLSNINEEGKEDALEAAKEVIERRVNFFGISEPNVQTSSFEDKRRIIVDLPGISDTQEAVDIIGQTAQLTFSEVNTEEEAENPLIPTDLTGADLARARVVFDQTTGKPAVGLEFTEEGGQKFAQITGRNVGKPVAILLDGVPVSAPVVEQQITGGAAQITGDFSVEEAKNLSIQLNAGALPVPIELVEQTTIGASLGKESVSQSLRAGLVGIAMVMLFMILVYGKLGLVANFALFSFGVITLAVYKLIPVVLTLPGIAGFLLSVGMAVDSNILIFERLKEERGHRHFADALEIAFGRAWDSIRDANIATLFTAFILANPLEWSFLHTSGPVRGFAITLALGIAISLFTGIVVSRNLLRLFIRK